MKPVRAPGRPPVRDGPLRRQLQAAAGHPQGVALLETRRSWSLWSRVYSRAIPCGWPAGRLVGLWPAERLVGLWPAGRLAGLWPAGRLAGLWPAERRLFADKQEQQTGTDIGGGHRHEGCAEAEMVDHPAQDAAPHGANAEGEGEIEAEGRVAHLRAGGIGQVGLQKRAFRVDSEAQQHEREWGEPERHAGSRHVQEEQGCHRRRAIENEEHGAPPDTVRETTAQQRPADAADEQDGEENADQRAVKMPHILQVERDIRDRKSTRLNSSHVAISY